MRWARAGTSDPMSSCGKENHIAKMLRHGARANPRYYSSVTSVDALEPVTTDGRETQRTPWSEVGLGARAADGRTDISKPGGHMVETSGVVRDSSSSPTQPP